MRTPRRSWLRPRVSVRAWRHHRTVDLLEPRQLLSVAPPVPAVPDTTWQVLGGRRADAIVVDVSPDDPTLLRATIDGAVVGSRSAASVQRIEVLGRAGNDQVTLSLGASAASISVRVDGGPGRDRIVGGDGAEELAGGPGPDVIQGGGGADQILGGPGNDDLSGGEGADRISGGRGRDRVHRQGGIDVASRERRDFVGSDQTAGTLTRLATDEALRQWLIEAAVRQNSWAFGKPASSWGWYVSGDGSVSTMATPQGAGGSPAGAPDALSAAGGSIGEGFSRTNVQQAGVDEADLVETDGDFIYTLRPAPYVAPTPPPDGLVLMPVAAPLSTQVVIADALPAEAMSVVSRTTIDGTSMGMYLVGSRLAVITQIYPFRPWAEFRDGAAGAPVRFTGGITGSAIIDPGEPKVKVTVFDVSDRAAPKVVEETTMDGSYHDSRAIGNRVYVILSNNTWAEAPRTVDAADGSKVYESEADYRARLGAAPLSDLLPNYAGKAGAAESSGTLIMAPDVYVKEADAATFGQNMQTVAVLNVGDDAAGPSGTTTIAGWGGTTYASEHSLYLASQFWDAGDTPGAPARAGTNLFKFELGPDSVPLVATGEVEGMILDQFSMDESGGDFRIATSTNSFAVPDPGAPTGTRGPTTGVTVLRQDGDSLKVVGAVNGLAPGERFSSARFVGDQAYLVTYKVIEQRPIDPLLTIDLRDPTKPKVAGELTIPGFSSYLQDLGDNLLLGIGRDTNANGQALGLQLCLFDVATPAKPVRLAAVPVGDASTWQWSEAEHNHLAVSWFPEQHVLAIPLYSATRLWGGAAEDTGSAKPYALTLFRVGREEGIKPLGTIASEAQISRSLRIGSDVFAVGPNEIRVADLEAPDTLLGTLSLLGPGE